MGPPVRQHRIISRYRRHNQDDLLGTGSDFTLSLPHLLPGYLASSQLGLQEASLTGGFLHLERSSRAPVTSARHGRSSVIQASGRLRQGKSRQILATHCPSFHHFTMDFLHQCTMHSLLSHHSAADCNISCCTKLQ